jgi:hypothetical protein
MKTFIYLLFYFLTIFVAQAQIVTLSVNQSKPLLINADTSVFDILKGNSQTLGAGISVSGGIAPFHRTWNCVTWNNDSVKNSITVSPGDTTVYTCKVTDANGCTQEQSFLVNVISPIQLNVVVDQVSCNGKHNGAIRLNLSGGSNPYNVIWADGSIGNNRTDLGVGIYSVSITDAMNQQKDTTITLYELSQVVTTLSASFCEGSSYQFNDKELTQAGNYIDSLINAGGCDSIVKLTLTVDPKFTNSVDVAICQGETYSFAQKELSQTGKYTQSVQSITGCDSTIILNLTVNPLPETPRISQNKNILTSSVLIGNQWWKDGAKIVGASKQTLEINTTGKYEVVVTNSNGCSSKSATYSGAYTSVALLKTDGINFNVFPNPNNGLFTVEIEADNSETIQLDLYSVDGKLIVSKKLTQPKSKQSILFGKENLIKGIYTLRVNYGERTVNRKLIVN